MGEQNKEMSFLDHLEELRWHLVRSTVCILVFTIVLFVYQKEVYNQFLLAHLNPEFSTYKWFCEAFTKIGIDSSFCNLSFSSKLQSLAPTNQLMNAVWSSFILGAILSFPYIIWEMMKFIMPGLTPKERQKSRGFIIISTLLLIIGLLFSYYVIAPMSVYFFYNYQITDVIVNNFQFDSYIGLITNTLLGVSIVFELPLVVYFLTKLGLITPEFLKKYRKHSLVLVLIVAAVITPPDVASQIIVAIPILILYEISIVVSKVIVKKQKKQEL
ncbi:twin-arginine translocase subunit TatC [Wenyingzhuangia sp. 2_MG-2023]|uniref:twin-arginine translocase subunit TatC n=1 Tax=Wenyingzhuangia sp. 2_MG-2023 TaxID=3062639 RepID=UPI0026E28862|nr:twin-arginine translocase subunit TatC [Wenyingzhuangia sp. 2_MG-2023]MDO6738895.1 twin-arginine translocase subunit TatC [Wenyingzhuangia sp. 2_MG-2023]MDO6802911.1 twin-arginine translocase subunit TatC [Wenyingzhuangia sp. 1_MG-2023]